MRQDLVFVSGGEPLAGWLYRPAGASRGPVPCVVLAHGFDGVRDQALPEVAARFADAGLAALVFDYRYFGASGGEPRQLFDIRAQLEDWRAAIDCARSLDGIDPDRIALWGTSTSAGHVVGLAAEDRGIRAVVAQVPLVDGLAQLVHTPLGQGVPLLWAGLKDRLGAFLGRRPRYVPAAGRPGTLAAVTSPDAISGLCRMTPPGSPWRNEVVARFTLATPFYRPVRAARHLRCPLLVCVADADRVVPSKQALRLVEDVQGAELRRYPFGHFAIYAGPGLERAATDQANFLRRCLLEPGPPRGRPASAGDPVEVAA